MDNYMGHTPGYKTNTFVIGPRKIKQLQIPIIIKYKNNNKVFSFDFDFTFTPQSCSHHENKLFSATATLLRSNCSCHLSLLSPRN